MKKITSRDIEIRKILQTPQARKFLLILYNNQIYSDKNLKLEEILKYSGIDKSLAEYLLINRTEGRILLDDFINHALGDPDNPDRTFEIVEDFNERIMEVDPWFNRYLHTHKIPKTFKLYKKNINASRLIKKAFNLDNLMEYYIEIKDVFSAFKSSNLQLLNFEIYDNQSDFMMQSGSRYLLHINCNRDLTNGENLRKNEVKRNIKFQIANVIKNQSQRNIFWKKKEFYSLYIVPLITKELNDEIKKYSYKIRVIDVFNLLCWLYYFSEEKLMEIKNKWNEISENTNTEEIKDFINTNPTFFFLKDKNIEICPKSTERDKFLQFLPLWLEKYDKNRNPKIKFDKYLAVVEKNINSILGGENNL